MGYHFRRASQDDFEFLYRLKVDCLRDYIAETWGWDEAFQRKYFADHFQPEGIRIILIDNRQVGQLSLEERDDEFFLSAIYIAPAWQNRGMGTMLIEEVIDRAKQKGKDVRLQVLKVNPAKRLYKRLGFVVEGETETHFRMIYRA